MLSERIEALYSVLQCGNTAIARYAGCTPGNISRIKSGSRIPKPESRTISIFAEGVYGYADYENMLSVLQTLCGAEDTTREKLIPALIAWLYGKESIALPVQSVQPRSRQVRALQRQAFAEKLDRVMIMLDLSNRQLASRLNVDVSLVSRYRRGVYSPHGNSMISEKLSDVLFHHAQKKNRQESLAVCCSVREEELDVHAVSEWLYGGPEDDRTALAHELFRSMSDIPFGKDLPDVVLNAPADAATSRYWGNEGLQNAVIRFLSDASREGGELILYSDEPMDWMSGNREFFALWASLMQSCVNKGVRIRIIHNVDREGQEMIDAIRGWLPLYISGMIEPYVFSGTRNARFCHTMFLHKGRSCIRGFFPAKSGDARWYDYITDDSRLQASHRESEEMLAAAAPFLNVYTAAAGSGFLSFCSSNGGIRTSLLHTLPIVTMPENLMERMISRSGISEKEKLERLAFCRAARRDFLEMLENQPHHLLLCLHDPDSVLKGSVHPTFFLAELILHYQPGEFEEHMEALMELVKNQRNFHLTLLPETPFPAIQVFTLRNAVAVIPRHESGAAFVFLNSSLTRSVQEYMTMLMEQHAEDRNTTLKKLQTIRDIWYDTN